MTLGAAIAMCRDKGIQDDDELDSIIGIFSGQPAVEFECQVWPGRETHIHGKRPVIVSFHYIGKRIP